MDESKTRENRIDKIKNLYDFCNNIGKFSGEMLKRHLSETLKDNYSDERLKTTDFNEFKDIWRKKIGPKYYIDSILSIERQIEILGYLWKLFPVYAQRKKQILSENKKKDIDLTKPAWSTVSGSYNGGDSCLKIGFKNCGCDYWHKADNKIGCYNCGFFINLLPPDQQNRKDMGVMIKKQFDHALKENKEADFDSIEFLGDGSFLNEKEVPEKARQDIFIKISKMDNVKRILAESRPEYINGAVLRSITDIIRKDQKLEIGIGLETADKFIATFCINKGFLFEMEPELKEVATEPELKDIYDVIKEVKPFSEQVSLVFYTLVKPAFLNETEALKDSLNTGRLISRLSRQNGVKMFVKYEPVIISKGTLLEILHNTYINRKGDVAVPEFCSLSKLVPSLVGEKEGKTEIIYLEGNKNKIDLFNKNKEGWQTLYSPCSYWTIAELISQLAIDDSHKIVRFGAREDMHVTEAIPGIYDSRFGSVGMLSDIDFIIYNAVQQFNKDKDVNSLYDKIRLYVDDKGFIDGKSFAKWKDDSVNIALTQIERDISLKGSKKAGVKEHPFFREIRIAVKKLEYGKDSTEFFNSLLKNEKYRQLNDVKDEIKQYIINIKDDDSNKLINVIKKDDIKIKSVEFEVNRFLNLEKPGLFKIEASIHNYKEDKDYIVNFCIPDKAILNNGVGGSNKTKETERKFIVDKIPEDPELIEKLKSPISITQGYISVTKEHEVRVRRKVKDGKAKYVMTWKSKGDKTREEIEDSIDEKTFNKFIGATQGRSVEKDRYKINFCFSDDGKDILFDVENHRNKKIYTIELDIFKGHLFGLICAEVEFKTEEESELLDKAMPKWFSKEVTFDKRFKNQNLSKFKFDSILIQTVKRYQEYCLCFSKDTDFITRVKENVKDKGFVFKVGFEEIKGVETKGEINAEVVDLLRSAGLVVADKSSLDINLLTKFGVREMSSERTVLIDMGEIDKLDEKIKKALDKKRKEVVISPLKDIPLSDIIESQHVIDNETLAQIEQKADEIWVITSTMEFDVGDIQEAVENNLKTGKKYVYFTPSKKSKVFYNEQFKKNKKTFEAIFNNYIRSGQVELRTQKENSEYYFKEIIIYNALIEGSEPFGFTYIVNRNSDDFELIEITKESLKEIIRILR